MNCDPARNRMSETDLSPIGPTTTAVQPMVPAPLEDVVIVDALSGRLGTNRTAGRRQIAADTDRDAVLAWLARCADSPNTLANSRREAERLLLWAMFQAGKPLSSLTHEDLLLYQRFLADPQPTERWVMASRRKLPRRHPDWRPFAGPLSGASVRQALVVVNSLFSWLVQAGYLAGNPLALARQRRARSAPRIVRYLDEELWGHVKDTIIAMPTATAREQATRARARWLFSLLFLCGLRVSEVANNTMGSFFCRTDKAGEPRWWIEVLGKGTKTRLVPATSELMVELARYRTSLGLAPIPREHEATPLLLPVWWRAAPHAASARGVSAPLTRAAIHEAVKLVFELAAQRALAQGEAYAAHAARLRAASAHWLRHTAGSRMADDIDLRHVRDTLGHASIATTSIYLHSDDDRRHGAVEGAHRLGWD